MLEARLEIRIDAKTMARLQDTAAREGLKVSELARRVLGRSVSTCGPGERIESAETKPQPQARTDALNLRPPITGSPPPGQLVVHPVDDLGTEALAALAAERQAWR